MRGEIKEEFKKKSRNKSRKKTKKRKSRKKYQKKLSEKNSLKINCNFFLAPGQETQLWEAIRPTLDKKLKK